MNFSNNNGGFGSRISFLTNTWGTFSTRFDRKPNFQNASNPGSNLNEQQAGGFGSQKSDINVNNSDEFRNSSNAGGNSFQGSKSYFNDNGYSSEPDYRKINNTESYQNNSNNFGYPKNPGNSDSQQNRPNFHNFGTRQYQSQSQNINSSNNMSKSWLSRFGNDSKDNRNSEMLSRNSNQQNQSSNGSNYVSFRKFRQHFAKRQNDASTNNTPAPSLFMGRDESYPDELNTLMNPFFCGVCNSRLNSIKSANIHYESKAHDKQVSNWMKKHYAEKGLPVPEVHRFVSEEATGPYRCELCKIDLTSAQHALQHNNGKRHKQAAAKISPPTGIGYYNVDGQWVETGKVIDKVTGKDTSYILVNTPSGFEPIVLHTASTSVAGVKRPAELLTNNPEQVSAKKLNLTEPQDPMKDKIKKMKEDQYRTLVTEYEKNKPEQGIASPKTDIQIKTVSLVSEESSGIRQTPQEALISQQCKICGISTTSYDQMLLHLKGSRHTKKLRALGEPPIANMFEKAPTTILASLENNKPSDVSMYRTPSGSYYCKTCNVGLEDVARIKKHISSKAHLAEVKKSAGETVDT